MRKYIYSAATVVVLVLVFLVPDTGLASPTEGQIIPGRYIVLVADDFDPTTVAASHGIAARHTFRSAVNGFAATVANVDALRADERVILVEAERMYRFAPQGNPTGIDRIEADKNLNANGVTVNYDVAIIDSGIDSDHPDLNVAGGVNFANGPAGKSDDGNGHGTHVAGTVAAIDNGIGAVGVAPGARLWAIRVCGNSGFCFTGDMVAGIDWVADQKATGAIDFAVANMSISTSDEGSSCSQSSGAIHQAICGLVNTGVVFAMAAGNDNRLKTAYPEVLTVSALADFDGKAGGAGASTCRSDEDDTLANFSNYGPFVDIAAPGICIYSTWKGGGYNTISGTSMASPHVAGAVALYLHANGFSPATDAAGVDSIEQAILSSALPQSDQCGYTNEHANQGSGEPLLFVNAIAFGGDGSCEVTSVDPINESPTVSITLPVDNSTFDSGATIFFEGSASDTEDGDLSASLVWTSDVDGQIGTGASFSTTLSDGNHTITASVSDSAGATGSASISLTVGTVNEAPTVSITSPADDSTFDSGATILFEGTASDTEDGDLSASLVWTSDLDGSIGTGTSFSTTLSDGIHTITASVDDSVGATGSASVSITVGSPPAGAAVASVDSISYSTGGGKNSDKHLSITIALVDDTGNLVVGASVSIDLSRDGSFIASGTGTTGTDGTVTFTLNNAAAGCYSTTVTDVTAAGLTWDGATPINEFCK
ncbi:MAG: S8 family serine peptidase [Anaerolineae bacterium]|nr:S8 family serine peptidase [Anaerolineae bacterium]